MATTIPQGYFKILSEEKETIWTESLNVILGREHKDITKQPEHFITLSNDVKMSRNQLRIFWESNEGSWYLEILSNTKFNHELLSKGEIRKLEHKSVFEIVGKRYYFLLPMYNSINNTSINNESSITNLDSHIIAQ